MLLCLRLERYDGLPFCKSTSWGRDKSHRLQQCIQELGKVAIEVSTDSGTGCDLSIRQQALPHSYALGASAFRIRSRSREWDSDPITCATEPWKLSTSFSVVSYTVARSAASPPQPVILRSSQAVESVT